MHLGWRLVGGRPAGFGLGIHGVGRRETHGGVKAAGGGGMRFVVWASSGRG
jgi:hypothetical protein